MPGNEATIVVEAVQVCIPKLTDEARGLAVFEGSSLILAPNIRQSISSVFWCVELVAQFIQQGSM